jgi:hypothetical protein
MADSRKSSTARAVLLAALLVGTLDIVAAGIQTLLGGGTLIRLLHYIASGALGKNAFSGGWLTATYGLFFHYLIATAFTVFFFALYPRIAALARQRLATGLLYGLFVWAVMNRVVVPLSAITPGPFNLSRAAIAAGILIVCMGLPLSFLAHRHFAGRTS